MPSSGKRLLARRKQNYDLLPPVITAYHDTAVRSSERNRFRKRLGLSDSSCLPVRNVWVQEQWKVLGDKHCVWMCKKIKDKCIKRKGVILAKCRLWRKSRRMVIECWGAGSPLDGVRSEWGTEASGDRSPWPLGWCKPSSWHKGVKSKWLRGMKESQESNRAATCSVFNLSINTVILGMLIEILSR